MTSCEKKKVTACLFSCCQAGGGGGVRLCDAGETEGDVTHFVLAVPSLIWTLSEGEWENREGRAHSLYNSRTIGTGAAQRVLSDFRTLGVGGGVVFFFPQNEAYPRDPGPRLCVHQLMVQPDLFSLGLWKSCL